MSSGIKGFLALSAFVTATVIGSAAFADCTFEAWNTAIGIPCLKPLIHL